MKPLQFTHWARSRRDTVMHVELHHLGRFTLSGVLDFCAHVQTSKLYDAWSLGRHNAVFRLQIAVLECRVSQSEAERKQRRRALIKISSVPAVGRSRPACVF